MTGSLQVKNDTYYSVINYYANGTRKQKWISTNLRVKGNKHKAEKILREQLNKFESENGIVFDDTLFSEYVVFWLKSVRNDVDEITYQGYKSLAEKHIIPYFQNMGIKLKDVERETLQEYIDIKDKKGRMDNKGGLSPNSLRLHRNILNQTLQLAYRNKILPNNPCSGVKIPQILRREPTFYTSSEIDKLLECFKAEKVFYLLVKITVTYGLRRSETLGLKWNSIDFVSNTIQIKHTVVKVTEIVQKDKTKNKSSYRMFPLTDEIRKLLLKQKERCEFYKKEYGSSYVASDYIFVWDNGQPISPDYVTQHYRKTILKNNMPQIRFHDLRHSCASILLSNGFALKDVQEWLGHSDISVTANTYGHLDIERKKSIADAMSKLV